MKNDIMIGDWLYSIIYNQTLHKKPIRVTGIRTDTDNPPHIQGDDTDVWYSLDTYEPIPLTEEILERNGFKYNKDETEGTMQQVYKHYTKFFDFPLGKGFYIEHDTIDNIFWITDHTWVKFQYVHELQHILKLCNINKEIEL